MPKSITQITFDFYSEGPEQEELRSPIEHAHTQEELKPGENTIQANDEIIEDTVIQPEEEEHDSIISEEEEKPVEIEASKTSNTRGRKSLKENLRHEPEVPADDILFQKQYYPIGEVAAMFHVNQSLIRFWETEFDILKPKKNGKGDRFFRPQDVKNLQLIHDLLRRRKFTIQGARTFLKNNKNAGEQYDMIQSLEKIKSFLLELKASL